MSHAQTELWWSETAVRSHGVSLEAWRTEVNTNRNENEVIIGLIFTYFILIYNKAPTFQFPGEIQTITKVFCDPVDLAYESDSLGRWNPEGKMYTKQVTSKSSYIQVTKV